MSRSHGGKLKRRSTIGVSDRPRTSVASPANARKSR